MKLKWARSAATDLMNVAETISVDNPAAARAVLDTIDDRAHTLLDHPKIGRDGRQPGTRELILSRYQYLLVYQVGDDVLEILRVLHQRQQWP